MVCVEGFCLVNLSGCHLGYVGSVENKTAHSGTLFGIRSVLLFLLLTNPKTSSSILDLDAVQYCQEKRNQELALSKNWAFGSCS